MAVLRYEPPTFTYRFMFADGATVDVVAAQDDSRLREWVLAQHYGPKLREGDRIAGNTVLPDQPQLGGS